MKSTNGSKTRKPRRYNLDRAIGQTLERMRERRTLELEKNAVAEEQNVETTPQKSEKDDIRNTDEGIHTTENPKKRSNKPNRSYCFTINNPTDEDHKALGDMSWARYVIIGSEVGEQGTPHLQGYVELNAPMRITGLKQYMPRAHLELRRGTREQARDYCKKEGNFKEYGHWERGGQGARNDLREVMNMIKDHTPMRTIMEEMPEVVSRNLKFTEKYQQLVERDETREFRKVTVYALVGPAGVGKSRIAREMVKDVFPVNPEDAFPFDGYDGEDAIVIDDYSGQFKYKHLLRILDGHQLRLNVKGGHRYAKYTKVFITSDKGPDHWYKREYDPQLSRRITSVTEFGNEEAGNTIEPPLINAEQKAYKDLMSELSHPTINV